MFNTLPEPRQRLTGKSPENLEEIRNIALDVDEEEAEKSEHEDSDYSDAEEEETDEAGDEPSGEQD